MSTSGSPLPGLELPGVDRPGVEPPRFVGPNYVSVLLMFARNSLVRAMTFRWNFVIEFVTMAFWFAAQIIMFDIIFGAVPKISGWTRPQFFAFMATGMIINKLIESLFMPNCANFSELIRTGDLDFLLAKPIDTQFLVSFEKLECLELLHLLLPFSLLGVSLVQIGRPVSAVDVAMYAMLIALGVAFFYSLMIILASTSIWFGRNQGLYDFWFYITIFARYPRDIYSGSLGADALRLTFSYLVPILLVVTVPAEVLAKGVLQPSWIMGVTCLAALLGLIVSRRIFLWSLKSYRSASS